MLKPLGTNKAKCQNGLNRIAKISKGKLCLRDTDISFNKLQYVGTYYL